MVWCVCGMLRLLFWFVCAFRLIGWVGGCYDVALWFNLLVVSVGSAAP